MAPPVPAVSLEPALEALGRRDWECVGEPTRSLTHGIHRYPSKYIPQIARYLIDELSAPGALVVDPFVGSGTTLLEATLAGRRAVGTDRNPLALLITAAKVAAPPDVAPIRDALAELNRAVRALRAAPSATPPPERFVNEARWFAPAVRAELDLISEAISALPEPAARLLAAVALSAIVRAVSNADPAYGNLLIAPNRPPARDTFERFSRRLIAALDASLETAQRRRAAGGLAAAVVPADARDLPLRDGAADVFVTHPPYVAAVPYAEYQRLSLHWLRTRLADRIPFFDLPEAEPRLLDRALLGGRRRDPAVLPRFAIGMREALAEMARVLRPGGVAAVVIGNPRVQGEVVALDADLAAWAGSVGLRLRRQIRRGKYNTTMGKLREEFVQIYERV